MAGDGRQINHGKCFQKQNFTFSNFVCNEWNIFSKCCKKKQSRYAVENHIAVKVFWSFFCFVFGSWAKYFLPMLSKMTWTSSKDLFTQKERRKRFWKLLENQERTAEWIACSKERLRAWKNYVAKETIEELILHSFFTNFLQNFSTDVVKFEINKIRGSVIKKRDKQQF